MLAPLIRLVTGVQGRWLGVDPVDEDGEPGSTGRRTRCGGSRAEPCDSSLTMRMAHPTAASGQITRG